MERCGGVKQTEGPKGGKSLMIKSSLMKYLTEFKVDANSQSYGRTVEQ